MRKTKAKFTASKRLGAFLLAVVMAFTLLQGVSFPAIAEDGGFFKGSRLDETEYTPGGWIENPDFEEGGFFGQDKYTLALTIKVKTPLVMQWRTWNDEYEWNGEPFERTACDTIMLSGTGHGFPLISGEYVGEERVPDLSDFDLPDGLTIDPGSGSSGLGIILKENAAPVTIPTEGIQITIRNVDFNNMDSNSAGTLDWSYQDYYGGGGKRENVPVYRLNQSDITASTFTSSDAAIMMPSTFTLNLNVDKAFAIPVKDEHHMWKPVKDENGVWQYNGQWMFSNTGIVIRAAGADFTNVTEENITLKGQGWSKFDCGFIVGRHDYAGTEGVLEILFTEDNTYIDADGNEAPGVLIPAAGIAAEIRNVVPKRLNVEDIYIKLNVPWGFTPCAYPQSIPVAPGDNAFDISASALEIPEHTALYSKAPLTLTLKAGGDDAGEFDILGGGSDSILYLNGRGGIDFTYAEIDGEGLPVLGRSFGQEFEIVFLENCTVPAEGLEIIIDDVLIMSPEAAPRLEMVAQRIGPAGLIVGAAEFYLAADPVELKLQSFAASFNPDYKGTVPETQFVVTAYNAATSLQTPVWATAELRTENGFVTLINGEMAVYAPMVDGVALFAVSKLSDSAALHASYTVDFAANLAGGLVTEQPGDKNIIKNVSITPNPLSVSGKAVDDDGAPIAGATVSLTASAGNFIASRDTTAADGTFILYGVYREDAANEKRDTRGVYTLTGELGMNAGEIKDLDLENEENNDVGDFLLYALLKVTADFYRTPVPKDNPSGEQGLPEDYEKDYIFKPENLYKPGTYRIEAYSDAGVTKIPAVKKEDGGSVIYIRKKDAVLVGPGSLGLNVKCVPNSVDQYPYIDRSSELFYFVFWDLATEAKVPQPLKERPVGTVTVRNTGYYHLQLLYAQVPTPYGKYASHVLPAGGVFTFAVEASYGDKNTPVDIWYSSHSILLMVNQWSRAEQNIGVEQGDGAYRTSIRKEQQAGRRVAMSFAIDEIGGEFESEAFYEAKLNCGYGLEHRFELSEGLSMMQGYWAYPFLTATSAKTGKKYTATHIEHDYDPVTNVLTFRLPAKYLLEDMAQGIVGADGGPGWRINFTVLVDDTGFRAHNIRQSVSRVTERIVDGGVLSFGELVPYEFANFFATYTFTSGYDLSFEPNVWTTTDKVFVQGRTAPDSEVKVSVEGYSGFETVFYANLAGNYSGMVDLPSALPGTYRLTASTDIQSITRQVDVCNLSTMLYAEKVWISNGGHTMGGTVDNIPQFEHLVTDKSVVNGTVTDNVTHVIIGLLSNYFFRVRINDNSRVSKVFVSLDYAGGIPSVSLPCKYDAANDTWDSVNARQYESVGVPNGFTVIIVQKFGEEYMSFKELKDNIQGAYDFMDGYSAPPTLINDTDNYLNNAELQMYEALPPEFRAAVVTPSGGGFNVRVNLGGGYGDNDIYMELQELEGMQREQFLAKVNAAKNALGSGYLKLGDGGFYSEQIFICKNGAGGEVWRGTKTQFIDWLAQKAAAEGETFDDDYGALLIKNGVTKVRIEKTEYINLVQAAQQQASFMSMRAAPMDEGGSMLGNFFSMARSATEYASGVLGNISNIPVLGNMLHPAIAPVSTVLNVASALLGIPDRIIRGQDARDLANAYNAMAHNAENFLNTECYTKLNLGQQIEYQQYLNDLRSNESDMSWFKAKHLTHSIAINAVTVATAALSVLPTGGGAGQVSKLTKLGAGGASLGLNLFNDFYGDQIMENDLAAHQKMYDRAQEWEQKIVGYAELACGKKDRDKSDVHFDFHFDPEGVVYDGTLDRLVEGVYCELWRADDEEGTNPRFWHEAWRYNETNPQITQRDGHFQWFTPVGFWQVRVCKDVRLPTEPGIPDRDGNMPASFKTEGYLASGGIYDYRDNGEWLEVLPPRFGVNINIGDEPYTLNYDFNGGAAKAAFISFADFDGEAAWQGLASGVKASIPESLLVARGVRHTVLGEGVNITREGYTFDGWNTKADGTGTAYSAGDKLTMNGDITLYAQWKAAGPGPGPSGDGLSGGAIAGIVIGSAAAVGVGGFAVWWFVIKKKSFGALFGKKP